VGIDHIPELVELSIQNVKKDHPELLLSGRLKLIGIKNKIDLSFYMTGSVLRQGRILNVYWIMVIMQLETEGKAMKRVVHTTRFMWGQLLQRFRRTYEFFLYTFTNTCLTKAILQYREFN
jgi:hypothetical protein